MNITIYIVYLHRLFPSLFASARNFTGSGPVVLQDILLSALFCVVCFVL